MPCQFVEARTYGHVKLLFGLPLINRTADFQVIIEALDTCGAVMNWYTSEDVPLFYTGNGKCPGMGGETWNSFLSCNHMFNYGGGMLFRTALQVFQNQFYGVPGLTSTYLIDGQGLLPCVRTAWTQVGSDGFVKGSSDLVLTGTWVISSVGAPVASHFWLNLNQCQASATCLSEYLMSLKGNASLGTSMPLFVLPGGSFSAVECTDGVYADQRDMWTQYLAAYREEYKSTFAGFAVNYDDINNIYTGAVGAFLGALAIAVASFLYYLFTGGLYFVLRACSPLP